VSGRLLVTRQQQSGLSHACCPQCSTPPTAALPNPYSSRHSALGVRRYCFYFTGSGTMPQHSSVTKRPAVIVGEQRRRLARRSGVPRSTTLPVLNPESATVSLVNNTSHTAALGLDRQEGASAATFYQGARPLESSQSTMNFCKTPKS
jgi:hypothetical protein